MFAKDSNFYNSPLFIERLLTIFVKGDRLVIYPFVLLIACSYFISPNFSLILLLLFLSLRFFFETIYWLLQQFSHNSYRPFDFGLKNLSNNSIYILYQLTSTISATLFLSLLIYLLKYAN